MAKQVLVCKSPSWWRSKYWFASRPGGEACRSPCWRKSWKPKPSTLLSLLATGLSGSGCITFSTGTPLFSVSLPRCSADRGVPLFSVSLPRCSDRGRKGAPLFSVSLPRGSAQPPHNAHGSPTPSTGRNPRRHPSRGTGRPGRRPPSWGTKPRAASPWALTPAREPGSGRGQNFQPHRPTN